MGRERERRADEQAAAARPAGKRFPAQHPVQRLQRLAGNRATVEVLRRRDDKDRPLPKSPPVLHMDASGVGHAAPDPSQLPPVLHMDSSGVGHAAPDPSQLPPVLHMDSSGVGHAAPDPSRLPPVLHMDASGVGHAAPDPSRLPPVLHMDSSGVGHATPDRTQLPPVLHMDNSGVGHAAPDKLEPNLKNKLDDILSRTVAVETESAALLQGLTTWQARLARAKQSELDATAAKAAALAAAGTDVAGAGVTVATEAAKARTAATAARQEATATEGELAGHQARNTAVKNAGTNFTAINGWFRSAGMVRAIAQERGPLNLAAIQDIKDLLGRWKTAGLAAHVAWPDFDPAKTQTATAATATETLATEAEVPLKEGGSRWKVVGTLQQKLNATRAAGNRMSIVALFDPDTTLALKAFQTAKGLPATGIADLATWQALDAAAPTIERHTQLTVEAKGGAKQAKTDGHDHPELSLFSSGQAVKELQNRLLNWRSEVKAGGAKAPFGSFSVDGTFGLKTRSALKNFQKAKGIPQSAVADSATWKLLDQIGTVSAGSQVVVVDQHSEGMRTGGTGRFDWAVGGSSLVVTVDIRFTGASKDPAVNRWLGDIRDVWNSYRAVEDGPLPTRQYDIVFNPRNKAGHHSVAVRKPTPSNPHPRSDAANWYTSDTRRGLAPHEFGHLIGLEDEYNRPEGQYVEATGQEPEVGVTEAATGASAASVAADIHASVTASVGDDGEDRIRAIRQVVSDTHDMRKGAFARLVAARYKAAYGFDGEPDISRYFGKIADYNWTDDLTSATSIFTDSNASIMGTMGDINGVDLTTLPDHEHPVQPRHLRHIADLLTFTHPGTTWKVERR